jgi:Ca2+-binding RTX toxin-like protein
LHEIGHNLGLKHGHITQTGHGITFPTLPSNRDGFEYSVMTYRQFPGNPIQAFNNPNFPTTFMQDDIAALQYLYGARYGGGPNTYTWSPTTGEEFINGVGQGVPASNVVFMTVWDGSGSATYNFSNYTTNMSINLNPGQWTILDTSGAQRADLGNDGAGGPPRFAIGNIANALIDPNDPTETTSLIRNVIAGSGNDTIVGNAANDTLVGGAGDDIISAPGNGNNSLDAGIGNDQLYATGLGNNTLVGGDGNDTVAASGNGNNSLSGGNGIDALYATGNGNETLDGGDGTDTLAANGSGRNVLIGGAGNDQLFVVGSGTNSLLGGAGDDLLADGGTGNDTLDGSQSSAASEFAGRGSDTLIGGAGADVLVAGTGNNQSISGGGGTDLFVYSRTDTGNNTAGTGTGDTMVGGSGGGNIVQLIGFTTGQVTVTRGTAGAATITFSGSGNVLNVQRISVLQFDNGNVSL